ncbi:GAF domain-containing sensor histidine kinase [Dictyobacter kobayashii]|uniref:histidine kinase n=1 Tax=Dictyobacter kobayashii TaxID=2014872 RepID=A0A402AHE6_9CHLR|nr:GAF domain-containing sensor histidine kinase [Dictyobacter kobayashii]GCE18541.1 hypothetical protein KDK_23410 [Dictyobacter kobayashii]
MKVPSGRYICVDVTCTPLKDNQQHPLGSICLFHDMTALYQAELNTHQANKAIFTLIKAISNIHDSIYPSSNEDTLLLPTSISNIGKQLTDLISQLLQTPAVLLISFKPPDQKIYYVAISGLPSQLAQLRQQNNGRYTLSDFLDPPEIEKLQQHEVVCVDRSVQRSPFPINSTNSTHFLWVPLITQNQLTGVMIIGRVEPCTQEEIELVKAVATLTTLIIECVKIFATLKGPENEGIVLKETNAIINEFLNLASHEFRTPLTVTMGNIQLALRRLEKLRSQIAGGSEELNRGIERIQNPLEYASQSAQIHERMISNIIDDSRLQANELELHVKRCNLSELIRELVTKYQQHNPDRTIELQSDPGVEQIEVIADANRIKQVMHIFITNALQYSPRQKPVSVRVSKDEQHAYVYVHDDGLDIAPEDQKHIWERFYRAKGTAVQNELDLSLGLSLYLCHALIQLHHGEVGIESAPGQGKTFWFSLPLAPPE